jgi:hypothetical protein
MAFFLFSNLKALVAPGRACVFLAVRAGEWGTCTESSSGFGLPGRCCIVVLLVAVAPDRPRAPVEKCPRPIEIALHDCGHHVYVVVVLYFLRFVSIGEEGGRRGRWRRRDAQMLLQCATRLGPSARPHALCSLLLQKGRPALLKAVASPGQQV